MFRVFLPGIQRRLAHLPRTGAGRLQSGEPGRQRREFRRRIQEHKPIEMRARIEGGDRPIAEVVDVALSMVP